MMNLDLNGVRPAYVNLPISQAYPFINRGPSKEYMEMFHTKQMAVGDIPDTG